MSKTGKPRIDYLDIYRAIAILAVVTIHVTSYPFVRMQQQNPDSPITLFYSFWNGISQFAVPSFVFLSGLVLLYNYGNRERRKSYSWIGAFYKKRLLFICIPYVIWSFIYFLMVQMHKDGQPFASIGEFLHNLLTGRNYEHLYYFIMLIQFYILFPLLLPVMRSKKAASWIIPIVIVFQAAFHFTNAEVLHWSSGDIFATYMLPFSLGALVGMNYEFAMRKLDEWKWVLLGIFIVTGLAYVFASKLYYVWCPALIPYKMYLNFVIYYLFTASASMALLLMASWLFEVLRNGFWSKLLMNIGAASFAIFLVHPLLLQFWRMYVVSHYGQYYNYVTLLGEVVVIGLSWLFYKLIRRFRWSWVMIGK